MTSQNPSAMSLAELLALPVSVNAWPEAGRAHGLGRAQTYELIRRGQAPFPTVRVGRRIRVTRADLLRSLGVDPDQTTARSA